MESIVIVIGVVLSHKYLGDRTLTLIGMIFTGAAQVLNAIGTDYYCIIPFLFILQNGEVKH